ncbi:MAG: glucosaminidase domain-containing protein [Muribaculaceae bacterium]|nr:glucosaminidase domain-containing protein [Muribaculaceae bacterium]
MKRSFFIACVLFLFGGSSVSKAADPYEAYIECFCQLAVEHQEQYGIPASITLAQGLLESAAGRSRLAAEGNNHFGIKCHKEWKGSTMLRDDDAPNECFRVYKTPEESFDDHSRFLRRTRYQKLFSLDVTDYQAWARGLRECGYATDPNYAARLITIIERYSLYTYDTEEGRNPEEVAAFIHQMLVTSHPVRRTRGLHYVVATPGDTYAAIAKEFSLPVKKLMGYNDVNRDGEIKAWEEVYLEEKLEEAPDGVEWVTIGEGESIHSIAQRFGMRQKAIKELNKKVKDKPGNELRLR